MQVELGDRVRTNGMNLLYINFINESYLHAHGIVFVCLSIRVGSSN